MNNIPSEIFNPIFYHLVKYLRSDKIRYIYVYGGSSAAKTYSIMQALSIESYMHKYNCYVMRKYSNNIKDTIYSDFKGFNTKLQKELNDITIIQNEIRSKNNLIRFKGIDDSEKLKGLSGFTKVLQDEITEFVYDDLKQVRKRLRGRKNQQIILTWNPVSEHHWIKQRVIDKTSWYDLPKVVANKPESQLAENSFVKINKEGNAILIKTTYLDNYWVVGHPTNPKIGFVDKHVIEDFEFDKIHDPNNYKIYALGEWGNPSEGLVCKYVENFDNIGEYEDKIYWSKYETLPDIYFHEIYSLDLGGGSSESDKPDGKSKTVFGKLYISKDTMSVYVKIILYKGYIKPLEMYKVLKEHTFITDSDGYISKKKIMVDDARKDILRDLLNEKIYALGAKTKEGGSNKVVDGYRIMKKYKIFLHVDDICAHVEHNNHKWDVNKSTGEPTGNVVDTYKDVLDMERYGIVNYDLYNF